MNRRTDDARQTANCGARKIVLGSLGSIAVLAALLAQLFGPASPVGSWVDTGPGSPGPSGGRSESAREPIPSRSVEGPILFDSDWIAGAELARAHRAVFVEKGVVLADRAGVLFVDLVAERVGRALGRGEGPGEILLLATKGVAGRRRHCCLGFAAPKGVEFHTERCASGVGGAAKH